MNVLALLLLAHEGSVYPTDLEPFAPLDAAVETVQVGEHVTVLKVKGETIEVTCNDPEHWYSVAGAYDKRVGFSRLTPEKTGHLHEVERTIAVSQAVIIGRVVKVLTQLHGGLGAYGTFVYVAVEKGIGVTNDTVLIKLIAGARVGVTHEPFFFEGERILAGLSYNGWVAEQYAAPEEVLAVDSLDSPGWYSVGGRAYLLKGNSLTQVWGPERLGKPVADYTAQQAITFFNLVKKKRGAR